MLPSKANKKNPLQALRGLQTELASRYGFSRKHVNQLVNGVVPATTEHARRLMRDYERKVSRVLTAGG